MVETTAALILLAGLTGFGFALWHAYPLVENILFLLSAAVYTLILENLMAIYFEGFTYAPGSLLSIGAAPLSTGLLWAAIIYAGSETGWEFDVKNYHIPAFTAVFAGIIGFAVEGATTATVPWAWSNPGTWFGSPAGVFVAWMIIPMVFTSLWIFLSIRQVGTTVKAVGALFGSVVGAGTLLYLQSILLEEQTLQGIALFLVETASMVTGPGLSLETQVVRTTVVLALGAAVAVYAGRSFEWRNTVDPELIAIPIVIYAVFGAVFLVSPTRTASILPLATVAAANIALYTYSFAEIISGLAEQHPEA